MLALLSLIPLSWRLITGAAIITAVAGFAVYEREKLINEGAQQATQKIEDANAEERKKADAGSDAVAGCYATGGDWDREHGVCDHPAGQ